MNIKERCSEIPASYERLVTAFDAAYKAGKREGSDAAVAEHTPEFHLKDAEEYNEQVAKINAARRTIAPEPDPEEVQREDLAEVGYILGWLEAVTTAIEEWEKIDRATAEESRKS